MRFPTLAGMALLSALSIVAVSAHAGTIPAHDIPGSHDSPLVSRFPGSTIIGYQAIQYDQATLPMGAKLSSDETKLLQTETVAGKVTRIAYAVPAKNSAFAVYHNYQAALTRAGFTVQFHCANDACGDRSGSDFSSALVGGNMIDSMGHGASSDYFNLMVQTLDCNGGEFYAETAHLVRSQGNVDVSLAVCGQSGDPVGVLLQTVEEKPMTTGEITVNAKAMSQGLAQNGHIALYGIHFATNSAALTADSKVTLTQMATLLKAQPHLKVYIVGNTDDTGTLAHNLVLSQQRAESVMKALEASYGVAAARMAAKGLASYAPVASNHTDAGRAKNRRVELVEQ